MHYYKIGSITKLLIFKLFLVVFFFLGNIHIFILQKKFVSLFIFFEQIKIEYIA